VFYQSVSQSNKRLSYRRGTTAHYIGDYLHELHCYRLWRP